MFVKTVWPMLLIAAALGGAVSLQVVLVGNGEKRAEKTRAGALRPGVRLQLIAGGDLPRLELPPRKSPAGARQPADPPPRPAGEERLADRDERTDPPSSGSVPGDAAGNAEADDEIEVMVRVESRSVTLRRGETVYGICKRVLGSGRRWNDVLALNGWTPEEARKLKVGTRVRLY